MTAKREKIMAAGSEPAAWWIKDADQFHIGKRPFAKAWKPLYSRPDPRVAELEAENASLLVAIEAKDAALEKIACIGNGDTRGNSIGNCMAIEALALSPSAELLEARDRKRDAKLLRHLKLHLYDATFHHRIAKCIDLKELASKRESGEWRPELGD